jgi:hypothetical protein
MENDVRALVDKLKGAVEAYALLKSARDVLPHVVGLEQQVLRAEAKVQTAEVTLLSMVRSITRK